MVLHMSLINRIVFNNKTLKNVTVLFKVNNNKTLFDTFNLKFEQVSFLCCCFFTTLYLLWRL